MNNIAEEELKYLCRQFSNMFGLTTRIYYKYEKIYYHSIINIDADPIELCKNGIFEEQAEVSYYLYDNFLYFGIVNYECYKIVIGPVSELKYSENEAQRLGFMLGLKNELICHFASEMKALSGIHLDTLLQMMIIFNFAINRTMYSISDIRIKQTEQNSIITEMKENDISNISDITFYKSGTRTTSIERDIVKKVMNGDVEGLIDGALKIPAVSSGQLAPHLLRHQKNLFIRLETIVSRAAMQVGLDADEILSIEEKYITKCESLNHIDKIKNLQYHMILDFADRVRKFRQYNKNQSKLVNEVTKYIRSHISESIKTSDIANYLGKNRSSLTTEFKKQSGINLSDYIKLKKIQEAEELLEKTNKSLSEIAYFLGFSSQSHFCKVFKELKKQTPTEYRNKNYIYNN